LAQIFLRQLAVKQLINFTPNTISVPALSGKTGTNEILHFYLMWYYLFIT